MSKSLGRAYLERFKESGIKKPYFKINAKLEELGVKITVKPRGSLRGNVYNKITENFEAMGKSKTESMQIAEKALTIVYEGFSSLSKSGHAPFTVRVSPLQPRSDGQDLRTNDTVNIKESDLQSQDTESNDKGLHPK